MSSYLGVEAEKCSCKCVEVEKCICKSVDAEKCSCPSVEAEKYNCTPHLNLCVKGTPGDLWTCVDAENCSSVDAEKCECTDCPSVDTEKCEKLGPSAFSISVHQPKSELEESVSCCSGVRVWTTYNATLTASLLSLLAGTTLAFSSPTLLELMQHQEPDFRFNTRLSDSFGAASLVGSIFGGPIAGYVADRWGRKTSLAINSVPYTLGYFVILATYLLEESVSFKVVILTGRFITGLGLGWSLFIVPIYIGEISPAKARGMYVITSEILLSVGILLVYGLGSIPDFHYYGIALVLIAITSLFMLMLVWIPETPRWLLLRLKDSDRALAVLKYLRGPRNQRKIMKEFAGIKSSMLWKKLNCCQNLSQILCQRDTLVSFLVAFFVVVYHQLCGVGVVTAYVGTIFLEAGVPHPNLVSLFAAGLGFLLATILAGILVEFVGRKVLLATSAAGICASQATMGIQFYLTRPSLCINATYSVVDEMMEVNEVAEVAQCNLHLFPLAITGIIVMALSFGIGTGPIPWILLSEYLPLQVRGVAGGIIVSANRATAILITGTFLSYSELVGPWFSWWTLSLFNLVAFVFIILFVVETKGKKLEEVQELFKSRISVCQKASTN